MCVIMVMYVIKLTVKNTKNVENENENIKTNEGYINPI